MFDTRFVSVVKSVLEGSDDNFQNMTETMTVNEILLYIYVRGTYPAYFGLNSEKEHGIHATPQMVLTVYSQ